MALIFVFVAGLFVSISNFFMRKSIDRGGTTKAFLVFQMAAAFLVSTLIDPVRKGDFVFNAPIASLGIAAGLILACMVFALGRALEKGPPGFTFSILNAATVMPGIVMAILFGSAFGFVYTAWHGIGSLLVLAGLFWAGMGLSTMQEKRKWILFAASMFCLHILLLVLFQWRALLLNLPHPEEIVSFFTAQEIKSAWFVPFMYLTAGIVLLGVYLKAEKRIPSRAEMGFGCFGGVANCFCTFFLIWATEVATPLENAIIFPLFSIVGIVLSNLWGQKLYKEEVNWRACQLSAFGLIVGTVDWKAVAAVIGL
ncbi:MAG: hypothetical protein A3E80_00435 [Chlamydiae bacterium RIFCSPHIGHO2_12_FULL_49_9]|nr:MAG: hypothetical protein A3E80_00435 [Chlamydiae bacterium RIFCSPHIGHO2_12_FULL_49_9]